MLPGQGGGAKDHGAGGGEQSSGDGTSADKSVTLRQALSFLTKTPLSFPKSPHPPPQPSCRKTRSSFLRWVYLQGVGGCFGSLIEVELG